MNENPSKQTKGIQKHDEASHDKEISSELSRDTRKKLYHLLETFPKLHIKHHPLDNPKVMVCEAHETFGKGVIAKEPIAKGELIAAFTGNIWESDACTKLPNEEPEKIADHVIQISEKKYLSAHGRLRWSR